MTEMPSALVTGSTTGIGKAVACRLLAAGYGVVLNYAHHEDQAKRTLLECQSISPHVVLERADVGNVHDAARLVERSVAVFGRLDVLVNNAAQVIDRPALEMTEADWDQVLDVNLKGAFICSQRAARVMLGQEGDGVILNIGASTGLRGRRNGVNTCVSKAGLMMLTQCLALELGPKVRVNTIVPGLVVTDETTRRFGLDDPGVRQARTDAVPMDRLGSPDDVADAVMLLLSGDARFITGQKVFVDGGQNMY